MAVKAKNPITILKHNETSTEGKPKLTSYTLKDAKNTWVLYTTEIDEDTVLLSSIVGGDIPQEERHEYLNLSIRIAAKLYPKVKTVRVNKMLQTSNFTQAVLTAGETIPLEAEPLRTIFDKDCVLKTIQTAEDEKINPPQTLILVDLVSENNIDRVTIMFGEDQELFTFVIDCTMASSPIVTKVSKSNDENVTKYCQSLAALLSSVLVLPFVGVIGIDSEHADWVEDKAYIEAKECLDITGGNGLYYMDQVKARMLFNKYFTLQDKRSRSGQPRWENARDQQNRFHQPKPVLHNLQYKGTSKQLLDFARTLPLTLIEVINNDYYFGPTVFPIQPMYQQAPGNFYSPQLTPTIVITLSEPGKL